MAKLQFILNEDEKTMRRSKAACDQHGLNTHITIADAVQAHINQDIINSKSNTNSTYHDLAHIAALKLGNDLKSETIVAVVEHVLLREPFNGNENDLVQDLTQSFFAQSFKMPHAHTQHYGKPAPHSTFEEASRLAYERLERLPALYPKESRNIDTTGLEDELQRAYARACAVDTFFCTLMGERALYNVGQHEFEKIPVCFLGVNPIEEQDGTLRFEDIPQQMRTAILKAVADKNPPLHIAENAQTMTLQKLKEQYPQETYEDIEYPEI